MPPTTPEALHALRERLEATQRAAQRLAEEASREGRPPPAGWDVPRRAEQANEELDALVRLLGTLRDVLPPDLRVHLAEAVRQVLLLVRAVLDWSIERMELETRSAEAAARERRDGAEAEDIPIA